MERFRDSAVGMLSRVFLPVLICCGALAGQTSVLTQHNDLGRTGQNLNETILTPASVSSGGFQKLFSLTVDGVVAAQPLYVPGLSLGGGTHNVVFVATEHDSVFAFDADSGGSPLWQASLLDAAHGAAAGAMPDPDTDTGCYTTNGEWGITGTPVIDPVTGTLYVVSLTYENNYPVERLHALDINTGQEKFNGPVVITASLAGSGNGSSNGVLTFNTKWEMQRAGLALVNGTVYAGFAAHCDYGTYHGWMLAYDAATLAQKAVFMPSPNGGASGIWMGGAAPAFDVENGVTRMFLTTGNGSFDAAPPYATNTVDYGDDVVRLDLTNGMSVKDAFTPYNQLNLQATDEDLGSSGPLILPDQPGQHTHLLFEASKGGPIYLVDRDNLGGYSNSTNNVVQEIDGQAVSSYGLAAYWNGNIYIWPATDHLKQFHLTDGLLSPTPVASSTQVTTELYGVGSTPSISANGVTNAIVWTIDTSQSTQVLYAHDATNVANTLWTSAENASRDGAGQPTKFAVPTVVNGKVYVGSNSEVLVYGLLDFSLASASSNLLVTAGGSASDVISISEQTGFTGTVTLSASNVPAGVTVSFSGTAASFSVASSVAAGTYPVTITGVSGTLSHSLSVNLVVSSFSIATNPASITLAAGSSSSTAVNVAPSPGFSGNVTFTCSVPSTLANVSCSVPGAVNGGSGSVTLTVTTGAGVAAGIYPITVTGVSGTLSQSLSVNLVVSSFSVATSPASVTLAAGSSSTATVNVTPLQGFSGNVAFSCSVASSLANVSCSVPGTVNGGSGSVTLTVTAGANAVVGGWPKVDLRGIFYLVIGLVLVVVIRQRKMRTLGLAGGLVLLVGLSGCGGGGSSVTSTVSSSATSESGLITVNASSGALTKSVTVSVTIQ